MCHPGNCRRRFRYFTVGGTYYEKRRGEKREKLTPYIEAYRKQLGACCALRIKTHKLNAMENSLPLPRVQS
jgi:hypothetical protein